MKTYRKGIFCVTYYLEKNKPKYLILHRKLHWKGWEFPKGGLENGNEKKEVERELKEETGLKILKLKNHKITGKYKYKKELHDRKNIIGQTYSLYSAEVEKKEIKLDCLEHDKFKWVDFKTALKFLTWPNQRKCLRVVDGWLKQKS